MLLSARHAFHINICKLISVNLKYVPKCMCTLSQMHPIEYTCGTVCTGYGKYLCTKCSSHACSLHVHVCAHWKVTVFPLPEGKMTGERRMLQQQPASEGKRWKRGNWDGECGCGAWQGKDREKGYDWLVQDRRKNERGTERMEEGREKWEKGEGVTANGVGLAEERWESREKERVGRRQASDSSTTGRGPLNDSLFLHDFNSWQSTGLLVASWQLYHYLLALSLLCIPRLRRWRWRVGVTGVGGDEGSAGDEVDWSRSSRSNWGRRRYSNMASLVIVAVEVRHRTFNLSKFVFKVKENISDVVRPYLLYVTYHKQHTWDSNKHFFFYFYLSLLNSFHDLHDFFFPIDIHLTSLCL